MTAFSKELAVVSRVVYFSRLADLLQEEGTSTGIAANKYYTVSTVTAKSLVLMLVEGRDTRCLGSSTRSHISVN